MRPHLHLFSSLRICFSALLISVLCASVHYCRSRVSLHPSSFVSTDSELQRPSFQGHCTQSYKFSQDKYNQRNLHLQSYSWWFLSCIPLPFHMCMLKAEHTLLHLPYVYMERLRQEAKQQMPQHT